MWIADLDGTPVLNLDYVERIYVSSNTIIISPSTGAATVTLTYGSVAEAEAAFVQIKARLGVIHDGSA